MDTTPFIIIHLLMLGQILYYLLLLLLLFLKLYYIIVFDYLSSSYRVSRFPIHAVMASSAPAKPQKVLLKTFIYRHLLHTMSCIGYIK